MLCLAWCNVVMGHLQKSENNKHYLHVDIKGSSLNKEPINYGKEYKESKRLQDTKYILIQTLFTHIFFI